MANVLHRDMDGANLHRAGYVAAVDPGAVGVELLWIDTSTTPYTLRKRDTGNTAWETVGLVLGATATDAAAGNHTHETRGIATFSGDGAIVAFTIPHGLGAVPTAALVAPRSVDAAPAHYISTLDGTNIIVTFLAAPPVGASNVVLCWEAIR